MPGCFGLFTLCGLVVLDWLLLVVVCLLYLDYVLGLICGGLINTSVDLLGAVGCFWVGQIW